ncbi:Dual specificity protein phosphatase 3 [Desmophyllum pertusum]|uniref:Dual specificity protein phosphatase n=1 Tax=Desmophyllum pertusum TaxID=174260 RepID=A0A9X0CHU3_9CNID|nr:Dual specificity protein phosphatase 3 [Desmophyllum pertusum]
MKPELLTPNKMAEEVASSASTGDSLNTTLMDLNYIITEPAGGMFMMPSDAYNEVFDGIFLSEASTAMDEGELQNLGITHLLNAAHGKKLYHVQTGPDYYSESGIIYHGVPAMDMFTFKLDRYFDEACDFIGKAVGTKTTGKLDGKILVHCKEGVSRSASLVLAYLVRDQEMHLKDAVRLVRSKRQITPNEGFLQQLIDFSYKLGRA